MKLRTRIVKIQPKIEDPSNRAASRAHAAELKRQIQALGGLTGGDPDFEENNPETMIGFYERVLAEERRLNGSRALGGKN